MSARERMIEAAAALLRDGELVLVGVGAPVEAASRARDGHAPGVELVYESGALGARPSRPPLSIGDPTLVADALGAVSIADVFAYVIEGGRLDTAFVGAAEIDRAARLNSTCIGPYERPSARLPGSGGAAEIVHYARRVIVMAPLERRRFPERVGFVTTTIPAETEVVVVTDRAMLVRPRGAEELELASWEAGESPASIQEQIGWPLRVAGEAGVALRAHR